MRTLVSFPINFLSRLLLASLVAANVVPLWAVLFQGWTVFEIMLLFCLENLIIGGFTVLRMMVVPGRAKVAQICFFMVHYGLFTSAHCIFVFAVFGHQPLTNMLTVIGQSLSPFSPGEIKLWFCLLALIISHGISFRLNFIGRREFARTSLELLVFRPYGRVAVLHITLILGAGLVAVTGSHVSALILLILLKIGLDIRGHLRERASFNRGPSAPPGTDRKSAAATK
jgi:hypothetical protein